MLKKTSFYLNVILILKVYTLLFPFNIFAIEKSQNKDSDILLYNRLIEIIRENNNADLARQLHNSIQKTTWYDTKTLEFEGHIRFIDPGDGKHGEDQKFKRGIFIIREETGKIFILMMPRKASSTESDIFFSHNELYQMVQNKMVFTVQVSQVQMDTEIFPIAKFVKKPFRNVLDRLFFTAIILFLFFIMVGIGMNLTFSEFITVFKYPKGIIIGPILQFGLLPLLAMFLCILAGFHTSYPFIYAGIILISCSPGGVISNLMTYWGKGDLALSISMTAVTTVLSIFFTPFLLALYTFNLPEANLPVLDVFKQILVLVLIPLIIGMFIKSRAPSFAQRAEKFLSALGIIALFVIIGAGVFDNLDKFTDTTRYGFSFHFTLFLLPLLGMIVSILISKLLRINNFQTRAIGLETGIRNAVLAMTIAILLQDRVGDFYNSMLFSSALYGLWMYPAGFLMIFLYKRVLPVGRGNI